MSKTFRIIRNFVINPSVSLTASTSNSEFPVSNLQDQLRSKVWRTTSIASQSVIIDLKTTESIDSFAVFFRKNQVIKLTGGATLRLEGNASPDFTSPLFTQTLSLDSDSGVISHFLTAPQTLRYWRFFLDDPGNPHGHFEVSNIVLGSSDKFDGVSVGFKWSVLDPSRVRSTAFGQRYYDVFPARKGFEFEIPLEAFSVFETLINNYNIVGKTESIMLSLDPNELFFDKDRFLIWGNFTKDFESTHVQGNFFNVPFGFEEML